MRFSNGERRRVRSITGQGCAGRFAQHLAQRFRGHDLGG
jgi:hypothetical protein